MFGVGLGPREERQDRPSSVCVDLDGAETLGGDISASYDKLGVQRRFVSDHRTKGEMTNPLSIDDTHM